MRLVVRNTCLKVEGYQMGSCEKLEKSFMLWDPITHRFKVLGMYYDAKEGCLYLPRGIDIWRVKKWLGLTNHVVESPNRYDHIENLMMKYLPRDEEQKEALRFMCGLDEYEDNFSLPQLSVNLSTGKGKTYCSVGTISFMQIKSIIITYSNTLLTQWKQNIMEYTNLTEQDIFFISGSDTMNMILNGKSRKARDCKVFMVTHSTIHSFAERYGWENLNEVFSRLHIGMKFIDEAHLNFSNMLMIDFFTNVHKTYYVTATPKRSDWREDRIYQLSIKNIPSIDLFNEDNDPHTDYVAIKYNSRPTAMQIHACRNAYGLDRNKYINYVTRQENFYKMMVLVMDMVIKCNGRVLFYIGTNESILRVYAWMAVNYPEFIGQVGIYTSLLSKEAKLEEKNKKLLLSTTKSAGLGEHIDGLKMTIVLAEPFRSEVLARQSLGRTRDSDTVYVELVDLGFESIRKFYYAKLPVFNKYAKSVSDTMINQYELDRRTEMIIEKRNSKKAVRPFSFCDERFFDYSPIQQKKPYTFIDKESRYHSNGYSDVAFEVKQGMGKE